MSGKREFWIQASKKGQIPLSIEKRAKGKKVTVLANCGGDVRKLLLTIKEALGTGGDIYDEHGSATKDINTHLGAVYKVVIQGDLRERLENFIEEREWVVGRKKEYNAAASNNSTSKTRNHSAASSSSGSDTASSSSTRKKPRHGAAEQGIIDVSIKTPYDDVLKGIHRKLNYDHPMESAPCWVWHKWWPYCTGKCVKDEDEDLYHCLDGAKDANHMRDLENGLLFEIDSANGGRRRPVEYFYDHATREYRETAGTFAPAAQAVRFDSPQADVVWRELGMSSETNEVASAEYRALMQEKQTKREQRTARLQAKERELQGMREQFSGSAARAHRGDDSPSKSMSPRGPGTRALRLEYLKSLMNSTKNAPGGASYASAAASGALSSASGALNMDKRNKASRIRVDQKTGEILIARHICSVCGHEFSLRKTLDMHMKRAHVLGCAEMQQPVLRGRGGHISRNILYEEDDTTYFGDFYGDNDAWDDYEEDEHQWAASNSDGFQSRGPKSTPAGNKNHQTPKVNQSVHSSSAGSTTGARSVFDGGTSSLVSTSAKEVAPSQGASQTKVFRAVSRYSGQVDGSFVNEWGVSLDIDSELVQNALYESVVSGREIPIFREDEVSDIMVHHSHTEDPDNDNYVSWRVEDLTQRTIPVSNSSSNSTSTTTKKVNDMKMQPKSTPSTWLSIASSMKVDDASVISAGSYGKKSTSVQKQQGDTRNHAKNGGGGGMNTKSRKPNDYRHPPHSAWTGREDLDDDSAFPSLVIPVGNNNKNMKGRLLLPYNNEDEDALGDDIDNNIPLHILEESRAAAKQQRTDLFMKEVDEEEMLRKALAESMRSCAAVVERKGANKMADDGQVDGDRRDRGGVPKDASSQDELFADEDEQLRLALELSRLDHEKTQASISPCNDEILGDRKDEKQGRGSSPSVSLSIPDDILQESLEMAEQHARARAKVDELVAKQHTSDMSKNDIFTANLDQFLEGADEDTVNMIIGILEDRFLNADEDLEDEAEDDDEDEDEDSMERVVPSRSVGETSQSRRMDLQAIREEPGSNDDDAFWRSEQEFWDQRERLQDSYVDAASSNEHQDEASQNK